MIIIRLIPKTLSLGQIQQTTSNITSNISQGATKPVSGKVKFLLEIRQYTASETESRVVIRVEYYETVSGSYLSYFIGL